MSKLLRELSKPSNEALRPEVLEYLKVTLGKIVSLVTDFKWYMRKIKDGINNGIKDIFFFYTLREKNSLQNEQVLEAISILNTLYHIFSICIFLFI
ncbi:hypothetical protein BAGA_14070 [Bacillus gaemokensis]|uniref:Uncharacterized protein n=1 Tax=Bacillus gaemokensis TaxID=574375 RepID=A0A073K9A9_9BACI|nr:hypothetical protein BAGA_14070 [Bacillus gaemokensis]KYG37535.1 hypothetical protein AZF08_23240 [Bacillus gaemokensis]